MKRTLIFLCLLLPILFTSITTANANELSELSTYSNVDSLDDNLPDYAAGILQDIGINTADELSDISEINLSDVFYAITNELSNSSKELFPSMGVVVAILLLSSLFSNITGVSYSSPLSSTLSVVSTLCISCVLITPIYSVISSAQNAIKNSSDFMLAFIPVMTVVLISSGNTLSGSGYSAMMLFAAESVAQFFSKVISPLLSVFLSIGITSSVVTEVKLDGIISLFSKTIKWLMSFVFTIFTSLLTIKTLYSSSVDSVSYRAVRYTVSSFVPVVGGALSEAYRTVHGSVGILKSGIGVFSIISVFAVFLPVVIRLLLWQLSLSVSKSISEILSISSTGTLLSSLSTVVSILLSVILCIMSLFIISTALVITIGGAK